MKILMTGGLGFLGFRIAAGFGGRYFANGGELVILDKDPVPDDFLSRMAQFMGWPTEKIDELGISFIQADVRDFSAIRNASRGANTVIHLAFTVGGPACKAEPELASEVAYRGTQNILTACETAHIIFASSDTVYGNGITGRCYESSSCRPQSLYGQLKLRCEEQIIKQTRNYTILRLPTNFGLSYRMRWDMALHWFVQRAVRDKKIPLSQGEITRTLSYVNDTAKAFQMAVRHPQNFREKTFNVASGHWKKRELVQAVADKFGAEIIPDSFTDPDARDFRLSTQYIENYGFRPNPVALNQGLRELKKYIETENQNAD